MLPFIIVLSVMRIRMLETSEGSPDGIRVETFYAGKTYEVDQSLGACFLDDGKAERLEKKPHDSEERETKPEGPQETKPEGPEETKDGPEEVETEEGSVTKEQTSEGSPWYQFRGPDGELITEMDDGEEKVVKRIGEENAERQREQFEEALTDVD